MNEFEQHPLARITRDIARTTEPGVRIVNGQPMYSAAWRDRDYERVHAAPEEVLDALRDSYREAVVSFTGPELAALTEHLGEQFPRSIDGRAWHDTAFHKCRAALAGLLATVERKA